MFCYFGISVFPSKYKNFSQPYFQRLRRVAGVSPVSWIQQVVISGIGKIVEPQQKGVFTLVSSAVIKPSAGFI